MATPIMFSPEDMNRDKLVDPGWYDVLIKDVVEAPSRDGGSTNWKVEAVVVKSADGNEEFAGVPLVWNFNSKAISFAIGFLQALGVNVEPDKRYDLTQAKNSRIQVYVIRGEYEGRARNQVQHSYKPSQG